MGSFRNVLRKNLGSNLRFNSAKKGHTFLIYTAPLNKTSLNKQ